MELKTSGQVLLILIWLVVEAFADLQYKQRLAAMKGSRDCDYHLKEENDTITSPGYPFFYPSNVKCRWIIEAREGWQVLAHLTDLRVEPSKYCEFDSVNVYDGKDEQSSLIRSFCGEAPPEYLRSTGRFMTVVMKSDQSESLQGFKIEYKAVPGCERKLTASSGYIKSPNYPGKYTSNLYCKYSIEGLAGKSIELNFIDFELEELTYGECFDYLSVHKVSRDQSEQIGRFCGSEIKRKLCINTSNLLLQFVTDQALNFKGFKLGYAIKDEKCTNEKEPQGEVLSKISREQSGLKGDLGLQNELIEMEAKLKELMKLKNLEGLPLPEKGFFGKGRPIEDKMKSKMPVTLKPHRTQSTRSTSIQSITNPKKSVKSSTFRPLATLLQQPKFSKWVNVGLRDESHFSYLSAKSNLHSLTKSSATTTYFANDRKTRISSFSHRINSRFSSTSEVSLLGNSTQVTKLLRSSDHKGIDAATVPLTLLSNTAFFSVKGIIKHHSSSYPKDSFLPVQKKMNKTSSVADSSSVFSVIRARPMSSVSTTNPKELMMTSMVSQNIWNEYRKTTVSSSLFVNNITRSLFHTTAASGVISSSHYKWPVLTSSYTVATKRQSFATKPTFHPFGTKSLLTSSTQGLSLQIFKEEQSKDLDAYTQDPTKVKVSVTPTLHLISPVTSVEHPMLSGKLLTTILDDKNLTLWKDISTPIFLQPSMFNQQPPQTETRVTDLSASSSYMKRSQKQTLMHRSTESTEFGSLAAKSIDQTKSKRRNSPKLSDKQLQLLKQSENGKNTVFDLDKNSVSLIFNSLQAMSSSTEAVSISPTFWKRTSKSAEMDTVTTEKLGNIASSFVTYSSYSQINVRATPTLEMSQLKPRVSSRFAKYDQTNNNTSEMKHRSSTHLLKDIRGIESLTITTKGSFIKVSVEPTSTISMNYNSTSEKTWFKTNFSKETIASTALPFQDELSLLNKKHTIFQTSVKQIPSASTYYKTQMESFTNQRTTSKIPFSYFKEPSVSSQLVNSTPLFSAETSLLQASSFLAAVSQSGDTKSARSTNYSASFLNSKGSSRKGQIVQFFSMKKITTQFSYSLSTMFSDASSRKSIKRCSSSTPLKIHPEVVYLVSTSKHRSKQGKEDSMNSEESHSKRTSTIYVFLSSRDDGININKGMATEKLIFLSAQPSTINLETSIYDSQDVSPALNSPFTIPNITQEAFFPFTSSSAPNPTYGSKTRHTRLFNTAPHRLRTSQTPTELLKFDSQIEDQWIESLSSSNMFTSTAKVMNPTSLYILPLDASSPGCTTLCAKEEEEKSKRPTASHTSNIFSITEREPLSFLSSYKFTSLLSPSNQHWKSESVNSNRSLVQSSLAANQYSALNEIAFHTQVSSRSPNPFQFSTGLLPARSSLEYASKRRSSEILHHFCQCKSYLFTNFSEDDLEKYSEKEKEFLSVFLNGTITGYFTVRWPYEGFLGKIGFMKEGLVMQIDKSNLWWLHLKESEDKSHPVIKRIVSFQDINENITVKEREAFGSKTVKWYLEQWSSTVTIEANICDGNHLH